ncbi:MAG: hypothetical protein ACTSUE_18995 [Promethearchaeota archaeon]
MVRKHIRVSTALVLQFIIAALLINGMFLYFYISSSTSSIRPYLSIDNVQEPVSDIMHLENGTIWCPRDAYVVEPTLDTEMAGGIQNGNLYAPDILKANGMYLMWYGGQGSDGHDSIHFATSANGEDWVKYGVAIGVANNSHVNDPSVVVVNGTYYMFYTVAPVGIMDEIWMATSANGLNWTVHGQVLGPTSSGWESLKVGRPSVLYINDTFMMWYDGSEKDPAHPTEPKPGSGRHVGYATSIDGISWTRWSGNPVFNDSGAIDVEFFDGAFIAVEESGTGIRWRTGSNQTNWEQSYKVLFSKMDTPFDPYGHVTPFIFIEGGSWVATYTGAATSEGWNRNRIAVWYPMKNVTLTSVALDLNGQRGWARSRTMLGWTFDREATGSLVSVNYYQGVSLKDYLSSSIVVSGTRLFIVNDSIQVFS